MDPATLAAGVAALLAPLFKKAAEAFVGEAGPYVEEKAKLLWQKLRAKMEGDTSSAASLERFNADPDTHLGEFKAKVEEKIAADPALGEDLSATLADIKRKAPYVKVVQEVKEAEDVVGIETKHMKGGTADVTQKIEKGKATGFKCDEIG